MEAPAESIGQTKASIIDQFIPNAQLLSNTPSIKFPPISIHYRNWQISTKVIHGQLWLQWQHPQEEVPRYGIQVFDNRLSETIRYARLQIDSIITLEEEVEIHSLEPQINSMESTDSSSLDEHVRAFHVGDSPNANGNTPNAPSNFPETEEDIEEFLLMERRWA